MDASKKSAVAANGDGDAAAPPAKAGKGGGAERAINVLKERHGGMSSRLQEAYKQQVKARKALTDALKGGPKTIPELATACGLKSEETVWLLMALRRYGDVVEDELRGDYYAYRLKEVRG